MKNQKISQLEINSLVKNSPDIIYRLDTEGKIIFINDAVKEYGYLPEDLLNTDILELIHPDDRQSASFRLKERRTGKRKTTFFEVRFLTKWHSAIPFELKYKDIEDCVPFLLNAEGIYSSKTPKPETYLGTQGIARDISNRKRMEKKLMASEAQKRAILDGITTNLAFVNKDLEILWANKAAAKSVNMTIDEIIGQKCYILWANPEKPCADCPTIKAYESGKTEHAVIYTPDGKIWEEKGEPVFDDAGKIIGVVEIAHDITKKALAEKALRESEEKYRLLAENANDAIFIAQDKIIKFPNPAAEKLTGYSAKELSRIPFETFIHPEDRDMVLKRYERRLKGENPPEIYSFRIVNKSGKELFVQLNTVAISWESRPASLNFIRDITPEKKFEAQNLQMQKMEAISTLAGGIAHDFNNLLSVIMGNISLVEWNLPGNKEALNFLKEAENASLKAKSITSRLITFSKGGASVLKIGSLADIINEVVNHNINELNARCKLLIPGDLWLVKFDEDQMRHVFKQLLVNAVEFSDSERIIEITAENHILSEQNSVSLPLSQGRYVNIIVKDQGMGISKENLARIFDPYFTTKEMGTQKGVGLGLAIIRTIIHKHKGLILAESEPGKGAAFHIYLPAHDKTNAGLKVRMKPVVLSSDSSAKKILVMDDEEMIRDLVCNILKKMEYECDSAKNGIEAVFMYKNAMDSGRSYDAVILDLTIEGTGMGGQDTIRKLAEINPGIKAIVSSGYSNDPVMSNYESYGFKGALPKPYSSKDLKLELNKLLNS